MAKVQANVAGAGDALMLDVEGFVSETNATNVFVVRAGVLQTPFADHCVPGITRQAVLDMAAGAGVAAREQRLTLAEVYAADEMFVTGTMGELTPVVMLDGRAIGSGVRGPVTARLQVCGVSPTEFWV